MTPKLEEFPWAEFLEVRKRMICWLRLYGNEGEPMEYEEIAKMVSCDPGQAKLVYMTARDEGL